MKRLLAITGIACSAAVSFAQTMNVQTANVTTAFKAAQTGDMVYSAGGTELTVCGKTFMVSDITRIYIDDSEVADNTVSVSYAGTTAQVVMAGNIAQYMTATVDGAHVTLVQSADVVDEITYTLSGAATDGSFTMDGELKATVVLNGVSLTSGRGAAVDIENGKRIDIVVTDGTKNTFADYALGTQKACFFVNGHAEFSGGGTVSLTGNAKHAYRSDEYTKLKKTFTGTINVVKAAADGLHVEQYLEMNGGNVVVDNVAGDGVDVSATTNVADEFNGQVFINGGMLTATTAADDVKALKSEADMTISGGTLKLTATGAGSKAIGTKGALSVSGGRVEALALGGVYAEGTTSEAKPNAVKATGVITISGGEFYAVSKNKAFNTDVVSGGFVINGGKLMGVGAKASASVSGTQAAAYYKGVNISGGQTLTYDGISYTVPAGYSCSGAYVLVSPSGSAKVSQLADNNVAVVWSGSSATVDIADNIARQVTVSISGAHVALVADDTVADEIVYTLSGTAPSGSFYMDGSYKATLVFNGLNLTCADSAAVNIRNGKRIKVTLAANTQNYLVDAANGSQKACFMVNGHTHFEGSGSLMLTGNAKHAFWGDEYVKVESGSVTVKKAAQDGFNVNQYFMQTGGSVAVEAAGDDGIAVNFVKTDAGAVDTADADNTGAFTMQGGNLNISVTGLAAKGIKAEGPVVIGDEVAQTMVTVKSSGGVDTSVSNDPKGSVCLKSDKSITINGGTLTLTATGQGGRAMTSDGTIDFNGGIVNARAEGTNYGTSSGGGHGGHGGWPWGGGGSSDNSKSAKGIKAAGDLSVSGGSLTVYSASHEGMESKGKMNVSGGVVNVQGSDDAVNSALDMTITGGAVYAYSVGNDGIDSNGNMYIKGGVVVSFGAGGAEAGLDVAERKTMELTGGQIFGIGGRVDGYPSSTAGSQAYGYTSNSVSSSAYYVLMENSAPIFAVKVPKSYSGIVLVSSPSMASGTSYTIGAATSVGGEAVNGFVASPSVGSLSGSRTFTARK